MFVIGLNLLGDTQPIEFNFEIDNKKSLVRHSFITKSYLEKQQLKIREILKNCSLNYNTYLLNPQKNKLECNPQKIKKVWHELASWGRNLYRDLFDLARQENKDLVNWSNLIKEKLNNFRKDKIRFDSTFIELPWGLIYDEAVPKIEDWPDLEEVTKNFWGVKYLIESVPHTPSRILLSGDTLNNQGSTQLIINLNKKMDEDYKTSHKEYFELINSRLNGKDKIFLNLDKESVLRTLASQGEGEYLHYYFCHHEKGGKKDLDLGGFRNYDDSRMIIEGNKFDNKIYISLSELRENEDIQIFKYPTVAFLNACESNQIEIGDPESFMFYFTHFLGVSVFIGTETIIPAYFASYFGSQFIEQFLSGQPIGKILSDIIYTSASENFNPFGLYYKLHGNGNKYLKRSLI